MSDIVAKPISIKMPAGIQFGQFSTNEIKGGEVVSIRGYDGFHHILTRGIANKALDKYPDKKISYVKIGMYENIDYPAGVSRISNTWDSFEKMKSALFSLNLEDHSLLILGNLSATDMYADFNIHRMYTEVLAGLRPNIKRANIPVIICDPKVYTLKPKGLFDYIINVAFSDLNYADVAVDVGKSPKFKDIYSNKMLATEISQL